MARDTIHPAKVKVAGAALVDVAFALVVVFTLIVAMITLFDGGVRDQLARAYVRQFRPASEDECPRGFGKAFWFACGIEVRRINASPPASPSPLSATK